MHPSTKRILLVVAFTVYLAVVAALTITPARAARPGGPRPTHLNLIPFGFSFMCLPRVWTANPDLIPFCLRNTFGNIALFMPLGILLPLWSARFHLFRSTLLCAVLLSVTIETIQYFAWFVGNTRAADIDDVLLNTLGACLGFLVYRLVTRKVDSKQ